jgi:hypothetical protein
MNELEGFDPSKESTTSLLPAGKYKLVIESCELTTAKSGNYNVIKTVFQICSGEFVNRKIFSNFNYSWAGQGQPTDKQKTAIQIGRGEFSGLCKAVGLLKPSTCSQLTGKTVVGKVIVTKETVDFDSQNRISKFEPASGVTAPVTAGARQPVAAGDWNS